MECRRDCTVLLLPSITLLLLFLLSTSTPWQSWQNQQRWSNGHTTTWETKKATALTLLTHQQTHLHAHLQNATTTSQEFIATQLAVNNQLQNLLNADAAASMHTTTTPCRRSGQDAANGGESGIPWRPREGRYLVMMCNSGQSTNHLVCLRKHMWFAAVLNRTLVLPPGRLDYMYEHLLDIAHMQQCLGSGSNTSNSSPVVMTFEGFEAARGKKSLHIEKLICYMHDCYFDSERQSKWEEVGFTFGARRDAWGVREGRRSRDSVVARMGGEEEVIAVGDLFYAEVEGAAGFTVAALGCRGAVRPHRGVVVAAERFVQTYLGARFVAVHFRRHGFLLFCNKQAPGASCFYPVPQAAGCIESKVREVGAEVVFLSTDAAESEIVGLVVALAARGVTVVRRSTAHEALAKWDAVLWRQAGREAEAGVMAMVDKTICAMAVAFVGTRSSSFSAHIQSMRRDMLTASSCDVNLCDGFGSPSFIASQP